MIYIDTNVIISYMDEADSNHERAMKLINSLGKDRIVSRLTLVELSSVYSKAGLEEPLSLAIYSVKSVKAEIVEIDFNEVLRDAFSRAPILKLRTLDLLHITACRAAGCEEFATLDSDIMSKAEAISKELDVKVITVN
ncbi:type II toxin-antitoxin system VapC family toxin [Candidatus Methanodesulfokora washburnensis]|nr:type II toxin-antitoxin system VapC family toxin [Candidatus Methanodesulfokores washburnensis]